MSALLAAVGLIMGIISGLISALLHGRHDAKKRDWHYGGKHFHR